MLKIEAFLFLFYFFWQHIWQHIHGTSARSILTRFKRAKNTFKCLKSWHVCGKLPFKSGFDWQRSLTLEVVWEGLHCFSVLHYQGQFNNEKYHNSSPLWSSEADGFVWGTDQRLDLSMTPLDVTPRFNVIGSHGCCNQTLTFESGSRWKDSLWIKSSVSSSHKATASEDCFHDDFNSFYGHVFSHTKMQK